MNRNAKIRRYRQAMEEAKTYVQWKEAALELDYLEGHYEWKQVLESDLYNFNLVAGRLRALRHYQGMEDKDGLVRALREGLHHDLGNMGNVALYTHCNFGTKELIEDYIDQVCYSLDWVCDNDIENLPNFEKLKFFREIGLSYGRPSLLLSGGASLGLFHLGVVKALWEKDLLPAVVAGSSAGSIVASLLGTATDEEIHRVFVPAKQAFSPWRMNHIKRIFSGKGLMDQRQLESCLRDMLGEYTFQEAYERSGRSINISVSPTVRHQKARLLSGYTSPFILVWSASLASCAVPLVFSPVTLMKRSVNGGEEPYMPENRYVDGSVRSDLPIERLMHLYDVNFSIVSQTNPHIVPFVKDSNDGHKPGLASLPYRVLKTELKFHGGLLFDHMRKESRFEIVRQLTGQAYSIMRQRYEGDITIAPDYSMRHYRMMMSNLTPEIVAELMLMGERKTWPKIAMIRAHAKISQTIAACVDRLKRRVEKQEREILARGLSTSDKANRQARAHKKAQSHPQAFPDSES